MYETHYRRPKDLSEAAKMFAEASEPKYIAGGQTLIPTMKQRLAAPTDVIDLSRLSELRGISVAGGMLTIGAGVTHAEVATSDAVKQAIPALGKLAGMIGDPAVRHRGDDRRLDRQ
jgi:aerobic carbon-monoxide dehydrogenase medium subunit